MNWTLGLVLVGLCIIGIVVVQFTPKVGVVPTPDRAQVEQTIAHENSSYAQTTNHMPFEGYTYSTSSLGVETPFRVNQFNSHE